MCTTLTPFAVPHPKWLPKSSSSTRASPTRAPIKINAGNICDFGGKEVRVFHCISFGEAHCEKVVGGSWGQTRSKVQHFMEAAYDSWQLSQFVRIEQRIKAACLFLAKEKICLKLKLYLAPTSLKSIFQICMV